VRSWIRLVIFAGMVLGLVGVVDAQEERPNFIIIFADDMGYGDVGSYGHPTIRTPELDQMARAGVRLTSFYVPAPVCSPSRAALLTGRNPVRCGMPGNTGPGRTTHLPESEITLANLLGDAGYRTMIAGKWHLGHHNQDVLPNGRGFDHWYGLPYSNDMRRPWVDTDVPLKLYRDGEPIGDPGNQNELTENYTKEAVRFIEESGDEPFFLYLAHSMPHLPVRTSERFRGTSRAGLYGDVIETIDWSTGRIREVLRERGIADNTFVVFTSDNGPWNDLPDRMLQDGNEWWHTGSPALLRGSKGTTYEGGVRVPMIAEWPGRIPADTRVDEPATTMDLFATFAAAAGLEMPDDRTYDGKDIMPMLKGDAESPHEYLYFFRGKNLQAVRHGPWKLRQESDEGEVQLFHLDRDPGERYNVAEGHPERVETLKGKLVAMREELGLN